ncbi:hypothetical protein K501DRAFT_315515, partial [Backusella circina FSU 941]
MMDMLKIELHKKNTIMDAAEEVDPQEQMDLQAMVQAPSPGVSPVTPNSSGQHVSDVERGGDIHPKDAKVIKETSTPLPTMICDVATIKANTFQQIWQHKDPLLVESLEKSSVSWHPNHFGDNYGNEVIEVIGCSDNSKRASISKESFTSYKSEKKLEAYCRKLGTYKVIKNKIARELMSPDLGPKMFLPQGSNPNIESRTKLYCDMSDAVNMISQTTTAAPAVSQHIFDSKNIPKVRQFVHELNKQKGRNTVLDLILSE